MNNLKGPWVAGVAEVAVGFGVAGAVAGLAAAGFAIRGFLCGMRAPDYSSR